MPLHIIRSSFRNGLTKGSTKAYDTLATSYDRRRHQPTATGPDPSTPSAQMTRRSQRLSPETNRRERVDGPQSKHRYGELGVATAHRSGLDRRFNGEFHGESWLVTGQSLVSNGC